MSVLKPLKVSFLNGILYRRDGVSLNLWERIVTLSLAYRNAVDIRIFVTATDYDDPRIVVVNSPADVLRSRHYQESDILLFDFGIHNTIFDLILAAKPWQKKVTYFHNITPSALFPNTSRRSVTVMSERQRSNLFSSDFVWCNSEFTRNDLTDLGYPIDRIGILYPPIIIGEGSSSHRPRTGPAHLLYVGRFVKQKGIMDLLHAVAYARDSGNTNFVLKLVGTQRYSDRGYANEVLSFIKRNDLDVLVSVEGELSERDLLYRFDEAHCLILPSYHEGFCLPIAEALSRGCYVISYDAGNLRYIAGGLSDLVPTGDAIRLGESLVRFIEQFSKPWEQRLYETDSGPIDVMTFERKAIDFAQKYSKRSVASQFLLFFDSVASSHKAYPVGQPAVIDAMDDRVADSSAKRDFLMNAIRNAIDAANRMELRDQL